MKAFIKTYGCQMNKYTSCLYEEELRKMDYEITSNENEADVIIFNTCSVRKHAEDRVMTKLSSLLFLKRRNPNLKIGIVGCMAQRLGEKLFEIFPLLNFVIGPNDIGRFKAAISKEKFCKISSNVSALNPESQIPNPELPSFSFPCQRGIKAYVPISFGCSNYCSYCIVPYTWGPLKSRPKNEIIKECESLLKNGIKEITLLGQDITSYGCDLNGEGLADILSLVAKIGIPRIRFLTSHPKGMNTRIIDVIANNKNICPSFHIPLQSGSNRVLMAMNRGYTMEYYLGLIENIREKIPESSIITDIIVGFPGETKEDFEKTQRALKTIEFDSGFLFKYSPREGTSAYLKQSEKQGSGRSPGSYYEATRFCEAGSYYEVTRFLSEAKGSYKLKEELNKNEKTERLNCLIKIQNEISYKKNKALIGKTFNVLVEGKNPKMEKSLIGRTETDKIVIFEGEDSLIGKITTVAIEEASTYTLYQKKQLNFK